MSSKETVPAKLKDFYAVLKAIQGYSSAMNKFIDKNKSKFEICLPKTKGKIVFDCDNIMFRDNANFMIFRVSDTVELAGAWGTLQFDLTGDFEACRAWDEYVIYLDEECSVVTDYDSSTKLLQLSASNSYGDSPDISLECVIDSIEDVEKFIFQLELVYDGELLPVQDVYAAIKDVHDFKKSKLPKNSVLQIYSQLDMSYIHEAIEVLECVKPNTKR